MDEIKEFVTIKKDIKERLKEVIEKSWEIFINQFINKKYFISLEAPFQLHFAQILENVGKLYCLERDELFFVDLEVKEGWGDKTCSIDIVCGFIKDSKEYKVALELKFKTLQQSAEDLGVMEIYKDIHRLEHFSDKNYLFGVFLAITDNPRYVKKAGKGLKVVFETQDGAKIVPNRDYHYHDTATGKDFYNKHGSFNFKNEHEFHWEKFKENYFLKIFI